MASMLTGEPSRPDENFKISQEQLEEVCGNWYLSRKEIEENSPSRLDGIDLKKETYLRKSYCTFLQDLGMRLKVPQVTIATAIIFCHRFFLHHSHARNDRRTIATVCMFLAGKVEETPRPLKDVILVSYEIIHKKDAAAVQRIKQKEVYEEQKEVVLLGERVVLGTLGYDLNVHHPYKPLVEAIKKFKVAQNALAQVAWNFVNDGLRTSLCLQFKPHHIAAGAIFLAAKFLKVKLPSDGDKVWWQEFDVTPRQLEEVSNQMLELYEQNRVPPSQASEAEGSAPPKAPASDDRVNSYSSKPSPCSDEQPRNSHARKNEYGCSNSFAAEIHDEEKDKYHGRNKDVAAGQDATKKLDREKIKAAFERRKAQGDITSKVDDSMDELERELEDVEVPGDSKRERNPKQPSRENNDSHYPVIMKGQGDVEEGEVEVYRSPRKRKPSSPLDRNGLGRIGGYSEKRQMQENHV